MAEIQEVATAQSVANEMAEMLVSNPTLMQEFNAFLQLKKTMGELLTKEESKEYMKEEAQKQKFISKQLCNDKVSDKNHKVVVRFKDEHAWNISAFSKGAYNASSDTFVNRYDFAKVLGADGKAVVMRWGKNMRGQVQIVFSGKPSFALYSRLEKKHYWNDENYVVFAGNVSEVANYLPKGTKVQTCKVVDGQWVEFIK